MPKARRSEIETYWTTFGQGPRAAVMIHCSLAHSGAWGPLARHLSGALTMTAFDLPGHGRSGGWAGEREIQAVTTEIAASFCDGPTDLIGHSFGATVALRLAVERPELARSLTLIEPVFFAVALNSRPEMRAAFEREMQGVSDAFEAGDMRAAARAFTELWGAGGKWEDLDDDERARMAAQMPLVQAAEDALYRDAGALLEPGRLEGVTAPALLLEGSRSPEIIPAINEGLAARLPHARRSVIAGAGHMGPITHPSQVASEILRFLDEV
ncbi:alpha/beta hydrolase [Roseovarius sp. SCSIO 43702]|uniref:alpha/beta fold hydrolase n=1 Tax=Roseovarius sp. SCSIO 43702 TaxID=2823043 RepID=UPI001C734D45|nr:alpha/beta hydrolase [Roseovarius sp. SCSIO 43702]QYX57708.1 alpha/beta hydrolase [Roseovarius sp. SCSIO 43702]